LADTVENQRAKGKRKNRSPPLKRAALIFALIFASISGSLTQSSAVWHERALLLEMKISGMRKGSKTQRNERAITGFNSSLH
jgi:hypothetical protein